MNQLQNSKDGVELDKTLTKHSTPNPQRVFGDNGEMTRTTIPAESGKVTKPIGGAWNAES